MRALPVRRRARRRESSLSETATRISTHLHYATSGAEPPPAERMRRAVPHPVDQPAPQERERRTACGVGEHGGRSGRGGRQSVPCGLRGGGDGVRQLGRQAERLRDAQPAPVVVHRETRVRQRDGPSLCVVAARKALRSGAVVCERELPGEVVRVLQPRVGAEGPGGRELVRRVAEQVHLRRCRGDAGEMQGRCRGDAGGVHGKVQGRCRGGAGPSHEVQGPAAVRRRATGAAPP